ncbi:MAG: hypothetical protein ACOYM8_13680, partial [Caulobacterales bacterium]
MRFTKHLAATSAVLLALVGVQHANAAEATAAADAAAEAGGLEEVVVTAQKRKENLQDTPIAISVLSAA